MIPSCGCGAAWSIQASAFGGQAESDIKVRPVLAWARPAPAALRLGQPSAARSSGAIAEPHFPSPQCQWGEGGTTFVVRVPSNFGKVRLRHLRAEKRWNQPDALYVGSSGAACCRFSPSRRAPASPRQWLSPGCVGRVGVHSWLEPAVYIEKGGGEDNSGGRRIAAEVEKVGMRRWPAWRRISRRWCGAMLWRARLALKCWGATAFLDDFWVADAPLAG